LNFRVENEGKTSNNVRNESFILSAIAIDSGQIICGKASWQRSTEREGALSANTKISEHSPLFYCFYHLFRGRFGGNMQIALWSSLHSHSTKRRKAILEGATSQFNKRNCYKKDHPNDLQKS
jgi:hypothetical protein